jgi:hypothetical protein
VKLFALLLPSLAFAQLASEVTTNVQLENLVFYMDQHGDATKIGTLPGPVPTDPQLGAALRRYAIIADVVSVGGKQAAGTFLASGIVVAPSNAAQPVPGTTIVDFTRNQMHNMVIEIMTPEKSQVGALYGFWMGAGGSAPGSPAGGGVLAVLGGTGAYVGVRGQGANVAASGLRVASMMEDPSRRRVNGGGRLNLGMNLSGAPSAEVVSAYHADFTPVTTARPVSSGEVLVLQVKAGWPVRPSLEAGKVFGEDPPHIVAIPVDATVNDVTAEVVNAIGWPGTRDRYRVDVRLPGGVAPGTARLRLNGAYLPGLPFEIPVR